MEINKNRAAKFRRVADARQNLTVILENIHDSHNIGAVLRTADNIGVKEVFLLYTEPGLAAKQKNILLGKRTSAGSRKWIDAYQYYDVEECFAHVRKNYDAIFSTHIGTESKSLYELDLTKRVALLFGNEKEGVSPKALELSDGNFNIPQMGMAQSLNVSVAAAVSLYEALRQRKQAGFYDENLPFSQKERDEIYDVFLEKHKDKERVWFAK